MRSSRSPSSSPGAVLDSACISRLKPAPAQFHDQVAVDDAERQAELVAHLFLPLHLERRGADDEHGPGAVTQQQLLDDQPGLDDLADLGGRH
jgi:hypothetical protein